MITSLNAAPILQSSRKKSIPDPYFNPRASETANASNSSRQSKVSEYVGAFNLTKPNTNSAEKPTPTLTPKKTAGESAWQPPKTPVSISKRNKLSASNSTGGSFAGIKSDRDQLINRAADSASPSKSTIIRELGVSPKKNSLATEPISNDFIAPDNADQKFNTDQTKSPTKTFSFDPDSSPVNTESFLPTNKPTKPTKISPKANRDRAASQEIFEPTRLLAMVGNEPIFVGDLLFDVNQRVEQFMPTAPEKIKGDAREKLIQQMLPHFVDSKMLYVGVKRMLPEGADMDKVLEQASSEFDDKALPKMMASAGVTSAAEMDGQLRAQGSSLRKMRISWAKDQLTRYFMSQKLKVDEDITHQEMLDDYRARIEEYAIPARAKWEQVMIRFDRSSSRAEAKEQIIELRDQIVYGANLAAIAKKKSHGFRAFDGGQHDWTSKGSLVLKKLDEKIFTLPVGELSDYFETADGFHVVRVLDRTEATRKPFLEAQVEIKKKMLDDKRAEAFKKYIEKLRSEIPVKYYDHHEQVASPTADSTINR